MNKPKSNKRNLIEWGIIIGIIAILYFTGLYTSVIGNLQRAILWTGVIQPNTELPVNKQQNANYFFYLSSIDGTPVSLSEFKGKTIFINFWASWCPPCRAEMPTIQSLYDQFKDKRIVFLMISLDDNRIKPIDFVKKEGFTFPVFFLQDVVPIEYQTNTIPTTFVISPSGKIVFKEKGMANYNTQKFRKMLNKLINSSPHS